MGKLSRSGWFLAEGASLNHLVLVSAPALSLYGLPLPALSPWAQTVRVWRSLEHDGGNKTS